MQRKNYILKRSSRSAMAMMMAIIALVVIATIMAFSLNLTIQTSKKTTDLYLYEQATLLSKSAAEYAMLRISQQAPCSLNRLDFSYNDTFDVNITMTYNYFAGSSCDGNSTSKYAEVNFEESDASALMDITITTREDIATEPIRYFRRSIQKL